MKEWFLPICVLFFYFMVDLKSVASPCCTTLSASLIDDQCTGKVAEKRACRGLMLILAFY
jgi:hypothetical protein